MVTVATARRASCVVTVAVALFAERGIRAVTLSAVAESTGASNGSVYHRFPDRPSLLAAMWLRTTGRFRADYRVALGEPTVEGAIAAAVWVVRWCRDNRAEAQVLQAGIRAFGPGDWSAVARGHADEAGTRAEVRRNIHALAGETAAGPDQIAFVMLDLPIAVVRRSLQAGRAPGGRDAALVRGIAAAVLQQQDSTPAR